MIYFIHCTFDAHKKHLREGLLQAHLANVGRHRSSIVYAGVVGSEADAYQRIVYFFAGPSKEEARAFVDDDPYTAIYESVEILEFQQRLPLPRSHQQPDS